MILGIGTDLLAVERISQVLSRRRDAFVRKVLTPQEQAVFAQREAADPLRGVSYLATRFAAKEAISKAFGTGIGAVVDFQSIAVLNDAKGKPEVHFLGDLKEQAAAQRWVCHISLSDERTHVVAFAVLEQPS